jgi:hypothetical protein
MGKAFTEGVSPGRKSSQSRHRRQAIPCTSSARREVAVDIHPGTTLRLARLHQQNLPTGSNHRGVPPVPNRPTRPRRRVLALGAVGCRDQAMALRIGPRRSPRSRIRLPALTRRRTRTRKDTGSEADHRHLVTPWSTISADRVQLVALNKNSEAALCSMHRHGPPVQSVRSGKTRRVRRAVSLHW